MERRLLTSLAQKATILSMQNLDSFKSKVWDQGRELYRDLPWRRTRDPYAIWISEVMLQQTQVTRVDGRWQHWLERFPNVESLAATPLADVLDEWQGMGYNSRAKRLYDCARVICGEHDGAFPHDNKGLIALPGIGPATAAGIRAFAFNEPGVYLETNVRTVFIHELFPEGRMVDDKELVPLVDEACPDVGGDVRGWYYALLDYGARLKKTLPNPSRRSKQHSKQSKFEGSHRQKRAFVLRCVLAGSKTARQIADELDAFEASEGRPRVNAQELQQILDELKAEDMIAFDGSVWSVA